MGVLIPAAMLSGLIGLAAGGFAFCLGRTLVRKEKSLVAVAAIVLGLFVAAFSLPMTPGIIDKASTRTYIAIDPREGEKRFSHLNLPSGSTSDFCYVTTLRSTHLMGDFQMAEEDFLEWMDTQGWDAVMFVADRDGFAVEVSTGDDLFFDPIVYPVRDLFAWEEKQVIRGYRYSGFHPNSPRLTREVFYDLDSGRAYIMCGSL